MAPRAHSYWPASAAKRLITCLGSWHATKPWHDAPRTSSVFAAEGTCAHAIGEDFLDPNKRKPLDTLVGQTVDVDGHQILVTETMVDHVQLYTDVVEGLVALGYIVALERRVSPAWLWANTKRGKPPVELFGTADCIAYHPGLKHLVVADLKFGVGVPVEVAWNPQLLYYAVGAVSELGAILVEQGLRSGNFNVEVDSIETVIVQPRAPHVAGPVRRHIYSGAELMGWAQNVLMSSVETSVGDPNAPLVAGEHCRWCPAKLSCLELEKMTQDDARAAFDDAISQGVEPDWPTLLMQVEVLETWCNDVRTQAHLAAERGVNIPGWKLVPKRATTAWSNPDAALARLRDAGVPDDDILEPAAIKSPFQIKSLRSVKKDKELLREIEELTSKHSSGTTIAKDSDPRKPIDPRLSAADAFND